MTVFMFTHMCEKYKSINGVYSLWTRRCRVGACDVWVVFRVDAFSIKPFDTEAKESLLPSNLLFVITITTHILCIDCVDLCILPKVHSAKMKEFQVGNQVSLQYSFFYARW